MQKLCRHSSIKMWKYETKMWKYETAIKVNNKNVTSIIEADSFVSHALTFCIVYSLRL